MDRRHHGDAATVSLTSQRPKSRASQSKKFTRTCEDGMRSGKPTQHRGNSCQLGEIYRVFCSA